MFEIVIICLVAAAASLLTFFSGFGLGTLLLPVFALFFPIQTAVLLTAIVHLLNNVFKFTLVFRHINYPVLLRFGVPALLTAMLGGWLLASLTGLAPMLTYQWLGQPHHITAIGLVVGGLILVFALRELRGKSSSSSIRDKWLPLGGALSGFFGGLSGHQGALRSTFLIQCQLSKEAFIATGVAIACVVDLARLGVYFTARDQIVAELPLGVLSAAVLSAFAGAMIGRQLLQKITLSTLHRWVGLLLSVVAVAMMTGLI